MDNKERYDDPEEALRTVLRGFQAGLWTAIPGIIQSFDSAKLTVVVQPAIQGYVTDKDGVTKAVNLPLLPDVPVQFQRGGHCTLTFPIIPGDECLVVFSSRCIDVWWQQGGIQPQFEPRMHDLSDGFALVGPFSQPQKISGYSTSAVQLRSNDGAAYVQLNPTTHQIDSITTGKITAQAGTDIEATAGGHITAQAGTNISATAGGNISASASGNISANAGGSMSATSSGDMTLTAPTITLNGVIQLNGPITQGAGSGGGTTASLIGPLTVTNDVTAQGTSVHTHVHSGVATGGSNTGGPV